MDALAGLLDGPRARGAFLVRSVLDPPWALRMLDEAPLTVLAVVRGGAWVLADSGEVSRLHAGDVAVARGPEPFTVADDPRSSPTVAIYPGQQCAAVDDGRSLVQEWDLGVRTWGTSPNGETVLITGTYERAGEISRALLAALPPVLTLSEADWDSPLLDMLAMEIAKDDQGQRAVLDRLLDLMLISVVRTWFMRQGTAAPAWYRAQSDPVVGKALRLLHHNPAQPWTVAALAVECGASRASFAKRFGELVGEPPMSYLTGWRMALASDLLAEPTTTVAAVARQVGYGTAYAFSAAFKRYCGVSPQQYRQTAGVREPEPDLGNPALAR